MPDRPIGILLVEDNPGDARLIQTMMERARGGSNVHVETVETLAESLTRLAHPGIDVVLLDLSLPDSQGLDTYRRLHARFPTTPVVVLSGLADETIALSAVQEGAQDYLAKGHVIGDLIVRSARYAIERARAESALRATRELVRFREIFERSFDAIALEAHPVGGIVEANEAFVRLAGLPREETIGRSVASLSFWGGRKEVTALLDELREAGIENRELTLAGRDAGVALVSIVVTELSGRTSRIWFIRDVTAERRSLKALHELPGHLLRARDEERRRVARDLHDGIAPHLVALSLDLAAVREAVPSALRKVRKALSADIALAKQALGESRTLSYLLHPPLLDEAGLATAIRWYADGFTQRSGIRVDVIVDGGFERPPREAELALFRVVQEALTNVHKHSRSRRARIRLVADDGHLLLEVSDRGRGLRGGADREGVGIAGMRERLRNLGGRLEVDATRSGTSIRAILPLRGGDE